jgi:hypothetical protein
MVRCALALALIVFPLLGWAACISDSPGTARCLKPTLLPGTSLSQSEGEDQPRPRDAAQAVQEGSITQWLDHYQRERGEEWARSKAATPEPPPAAGSVTPPSPAPQTPASDR